MAAFHLSVKLVEVTCMQTLLHQHMSVALLFLHTPHFLSLCTYPG